MTRGRGLRIAGWSYCALILLFLLFPVAIMVPASFSGSQTLEFPPNTWSFHWYRQVLADGRWLESAFLSLRIALFAAAVATVSGLMVSVVHLRFGRVAPTLRAFFLLPLIAPHIVLATGLFSLLLRMHAAGQPDRAGVWPCVSGIAAERLWCWSMRWRRSSRCFGPRLPRWAPAGG